MPRADSHLATVPCRRVAIPVKMVVLVSTCRLPRGIAEREVSDAGLVATSLCPRKFGPQWHKEFVDGPEHHHIHPT